MTVRRWLLCEECREGELDSVVALGDKVTAALGEAVKGPPVAGRENIQRQAEATFARLASPPLQRQVYVQHFVDNYVATYQSRAGVALGLIGTPRAHAALVEAVGNDSIPYRDDVRRILSAAAQVLVSAVDTVAQSAPADSFVRANPSIVVIDGRDSTPLPNIRVVFRAAPGSGVVADSIQRTSANGIATVRWRLGPAIDSTNLLRAFAAGMEVQFLAIGRGPDSRVVFVQQPSNGRAWQPIAPPVRVAVLDAWGQVVTTFGGPVALSVTDPAAIGMTVVDSSPGPDSLVAGGMTFSRLMLNLPGTGLQLIASVNGATQAVSAPFDILP